MCAWSSGTDVCSAWSCNDAGGTTPDADAWCEKSECKTWPQYGAVAPILPSIFSIAPGRSSGEHRHSFRVLLPRHPAVPITCTAAVRLHGCSDLGCYRMDDSGLHAGKQIRRLGHRQIIGCEKGQPCSRERQWSGQPVKSPGKRWRVFGFQD